MPGREHVYIFGIKIIPTLSGLTYGITETRPTGLMLTC